VTETEYKQLLDQYPFLTYLTYGKTEYIGIIQNVDDVVTTIYDYGSLRTNEQKQNFIRLGEEWWWESSRQIPINLFIKQDWVPFRECLRTLNSRDVVIHHGPYVSLREMSAKKSKRRSITLVKKI
jgi:hypothetical protein